MLVGIETVCAAQSIMQWEYTISIVTLTGSVKTQRSNHLLVTPTPTYILIYVFLPIDRNDGEITEK